MNMRFRLVTRFCEDMCSRVDYMSPEFYDDVTYMVLVLTEYYWNCRIMIGGTPRLENLSFKMF